jgi:hypothetical protein
MGESISPLAFFKADIIFYAAVMASPILYGWETRYNITNCLCGGDFAKAPLMRVTQK